MTKLRDKYNGQIEDKGYGKTERQMMRLNRGENNMTNLKDKDMTKVWGNLSLT